MRRIGAVLVALAILCGYGLYTSLSSKLRIRNQGERAPGVITRYDSLAGHSFPVVRFRAFDGNIYEVRSRESYLALAAPGVHTAVDVFYEVIPPRDIEVRVHSGLAEFQWLLTPALLASLFVILMLTGLRFLLILPGEALDASC